MLQNYRSKYICTKSVWIPQPPPWQRMYVDICHVFYLSQCLLKRSWSRFELNVFDELDRVSYHHTFWSFIAQLALTSPIDVVWVLLISRVCCLFVYFCFLLPWHCHHERKVALTWSNYQWLLHHLKGKSSRRKVTPKGTHEDRAESSMTWPENSMSRWDMMIWFHSFRFYMDWNMNDPILIYLIKRNPGIAMSYPSNVWLVLFLQCYPSNWCNDWSKNAPPLRVDFAATITMYIRSTVIMADPGRRREDFLGGGRWVGSTFRSAGAVLIARKEN